jgi:transposase
MASNYERIFYRDHEKALKEIDELKALYAEVRAGIKALKSNHIKDIADIKAEHRREIALIRAEHEKQVSGLHEEISNLKEENRKLHTQISKDSSNSGKPPSSDGFGKPPKNIPNSRKRSGKRPGGQKGHKGNIPILFENPDETIDLRPSMCGCGGRISYADKPVRKQIVEIVIERHVTEYKDEIGICAVCGKRHLPKFPPRVHNPINIGASLKTLSAALHTEYAMPLGKIVQFVSDFTEGKIHLSEATAVNACKELSARIKPSIASIKEKLFLSPVLHKDETGIRTNGAHEWLHVLVTETLALYARDAKRGKDADVRMGVLSGYPGTLVHDHLKALYAWKCSHAECNAHLIRYLIGIIENEPEYAAYAKEMLSLILDAHRRRKKAKKRGQRKFSMKTVNAYRSEYDDILRRWRIAIKNILRKTGKKKRYKREGEKLCARLLAYKDEHLLFISDFMIPFDNNLAERALRGIKTKTKVSGGFRTDSGADVYANLRSYVETLRRQEKNIREGIALAFAGKPVLF